MLITFCYLQVLTKRHQRNKSSYQRVTSGRHQNVAWRGPNTKQGLCREFRFCSFGRTFVYLNTRTAAQALLGKRYQAFVRTEDSKKKLDIS
jgi:hypothetical protein